jgi:hypothetical protein
MAPRKFLAQDMACLAQALAAAGVEDAVLLDLLAQEAARKAPIFKLQQLTAVLQAYSDLGWPHAGLQGAAAARLQQLLPKAAVDQALSCGAALAGLQPVPWELMLGLGQLVLDGGRVLGKQQALELLAVMASACQQPVDALTAGGGHAAAQGPASMAVDDPSSNRGSSSSSKRKRNHTKANQQGLDGSSSSSSSSSRLPTSLVRVVLAAVAGTPLSDWTGAEAEQAARSLAALQLQPLQATAAAVGAVAAAAVAHAASSTPQQLVSVLWGVSACGWRDPLLLQVVMDAVMPDAAGAVTASTSASVASGDSSRSSNSSNTSSSQGPLSLDELLADLPDMPGMAGPAAPGPGRRALAARQPAAVDRTGHAAASVDALPAAQLLVVSPCGLAPRREPSKRRSVLKQLGVQGVAELLWALQQHGRNDLAALVMEEQAKPRRKRRP